MQGNKLQIISELKGYARKHALNQSIQGVVFLILAVGSYFLLLFLCEERYYFGVNIRTIIFYVSILWIVGSLWWFVIRHLLAFLGLRKSIKLTEVSRIISTHFPHIEDKLLNILELTEGSEADEPLVIASIKQKTKAIAIVPIDKAFSLRISKKVLSGIGVLLLCYLLIGWINPLILTQTPQRLKDYNVPFSRKAPFSFTILNDSLKVARGGSIPILVKFDGTELPEIVYLQLAGSQFMMEKQEDKVYRYILNNINNSFDFRISAGGFYSDFKHVKMLEVPEIVKFKVTVNPPKYTGIHSYVQDNDGNIEVPAGAVINWNLWSYFSDSAAIVSDSTYFEMKSIETGVFHRELQVTNDFNYHFTTKNNWFTQDDEVIHSVKVIRDEFPQISVVEVVDSVLFTTYYFKGTISDDYGFRTLNFHYQTAAWDSVVSLPFPRNRKESEFYYAFDFKWFKEEPITYYFSVSDNDNINGSKHTESDRLTFQFPDFNQLNGIKEEAYTKMDAFAEEGKLISEQIRQALTDIKMKQVDGVMSKWEREEILQGIDGKKNELNELVNQLGRENRSVNQMEESFSSLSPSIVKKQQEIQELIDDVFSDELNELLSELNDLMDDYQSDKFESLKSQVENRLKHFEKELDRNLELLKRLKVEKGIRDVSKALTKLAEKERETGELMKKHSIQEQEFERFAEKQMQDFNSLEDFLNDVLAENKLLNSPMNIEAFNIERKEINEQLNSRLKEEAKHKGKKAAATANQIADKMDNLAFAMGQMMQNDEQMTLKENLADLNTILQNLITFSFRQEEVLSKMKGLYSMDPRLNDLRAQQYQIGQLQASFRDSLYALSERTPQIKSFVSEELVRLDEHIKSAFNFFEGGRYAQVRTEQQFVMTTANNLAVFLEEVIDQIRKMMENAQSGSGDCENPGGSGQGDVSSLKEAQEQFKQQLEVMIKQLKQGEGLQGSAVGQALMSQELLQKAYQDLMMSGTLGNESLQALQEAEKLLEKTKHDLLGNRMNEQLIQRQNAIMKHLLEAETAEMERDVDDKRESNMVSKYKISNPSSYFKSTNDSLRGVLQQDDQPIRFVPYYREKYRKYKAQMND